VVCAKVAQPFRAALARLKPCATVPCRWISPPDEWSSVRSSPFCNRDDAVGGDVFETIDVPARPPHVEALDLGCAADAEVRAEVVLTEVLRSRLSPTFRGHLF
jgi:hypothetical protein